MKIKDIIASLKKLGPNVDVTNIKGKFSYPDYDDDYDDDDESDQKPMMTGVEVTLNLTPSTPDEENDVDEEDKPFFNKLNDLSDLARRGKNSSL